MDISKNRGGFPPKWMVYRGKPYEQMDEYGFFPIFLETPICAMVKSCYIGDGHPTFNDGILIIGI